MTLRPLPWWAPAGLLSLGVVLAFSTQRQQLPALRAPLADLPRELVGRTGADRRFTPLEEQVAGMTSYVLRSFGSDSAAPDFTVYVGFYERQTQGRTIHSPKNCLPGAGWQALTSSIDSVETVLGRVPVNRYELLNGRRRALVLYWYQGRGRIEANEYRVKWELLRDAVIRRRSDEALVRIVVPVAPDAREGEATALAHAVARELAPAVDRVLPE